MTSKRALFIGRFQPFHKGHLSVIEAIEREEDIGELYIGIGSAQHTNQPKNPFSASERRDMVVSSLNLKKPYKVFEVPDRNDDTIWFDYLMEQCAPFHTIYTGNPRVANIFFPLGYEVRLPNESYKVCATHVRSLMANEGAWQEYLPAGTIEVLTRINGPTRVKDIFSSIVQQGAVV